jgi:glycosyltransferase involved in cell wall biosynthesis
MKILIGITQSNFGGAQRHVLDLATGLSRDTFDVAVVHGGDGLLAERLRERGIRTIPLAALGRSVSVFNDIASFFALVKVLRKERPDVFHIHSSKMGGLGALAARIARVPRIVFTAHGWAFNENRSAFARGCIYFLALLTVHLSHATIAVSEAVRDDIKNAVARRKITVIYNGVEKTTALSRDAARSELRTTDPTLKDGLWIVTVAELHPIKGLDVGLEAFKAFLATHPNTHYCVIGEGSMRSRLETKMTELGLAGHAHLVGFLDATRFLSAFDIFLLPSFSEGLSYGVLEAGAAHLPVIATRVGGVPEILMGESGILVAPHDPAAITVALTRLADAPELRQSLSDALSARVTKRFSLNQMIEATRKIYMR